MRAISCSRLGAIRWLRSTPWRWTRVSTASNPQEQGHPPLEPFSDSEVASAVGGTPGDPEVEEIEPAHIDERAGDQETPFEKLVQKSARLTPEKVKRVLQSL